MTTWKVTYQDVPYNYTSPAVVLIEAETKEDARATAIDHLTRQGHAVYSSQDGLVVGKTHIREVIEYKAKAPGKVVGR